ncbi:MAG: UDP-N-acetylglucosamine 4,6-dehydratase (inverting) [Parachlamydiaceae bacterium]
MDFTDKTVLITGGTGSFGRAFATYLVNETRCKKIIIFSRDEWKQGEMRSQHPAFSSDRMRFFLGDVRDPNRLARAFQDVDIVIHAAALKQVPAAEYNPTEFVKTNVLGAMNVIDAAIDAGVKRVIALSTDKAVNPVNMYGATKLCSDKLFAASNAYVGKKSYPLLSVVRYGNVAGSRGSIIPLWLKSLKDPSTQLSVTDVRMTRFWISLKEAVALVALCLNEMRGGEIFVPKIPSFHITDLAEVMAPGRPFKIIGIREGEKLHELMIGTDDSRHTLDFGNYYAIIPEHYVHEEAKLKALIGNRKAEFLQDGFAYTSDTNPDWLDKNSLNASLAAIMNDENL